MTTARDVIWALLCSFLVAGSVFATIWIWAAIFSAFLNVGR
jgi:hypothetical protein